jgi:hypothetical protein
LEFVLKIVTTITTGSCGIRNSGLLRLQQNELLNVVIT